jgi:hypothetical protein
MSSNERKVAADIIRGAVSVGSTIAGLAGSLDPRIGPIAKLVELILNSVATLVENVGANKALEILEELRKNPATAISDEELAADVDAVKREFGTIPTTKPPPNPFDDPEDV